jgi:uncharacterized repeat protein (TIGR03943 family)
MQSRICNLINACTLFGLGTVFLSFYGTGRIEQYLNPSFRPFVMIGGILMFIMGVTCLLTLPSEHCRSEGGCDHRHASRLSVSLASFGLICVSVLAGSTFSKDAFDQQIFVNRGSMDEDSKRSGGFASNAVIPAVSKNGIVRDLTAEDNIAVEITDLLRAKTTEPLRNFIAEKNVAVVGQFVAGRTEESFRLTRMFIWCCAADARPIHVTVEVSAPVGVPNFQWVKVIGRPQYSFAEGHASLLLKAYSVVPIKAPKAAMLY